MPTRLDPLDDHLAIAPSTGEDETASGIVLPIITAAAIATGVVLSVGGDVTGIAPGDKVLYHRERAFEVRVGQEAVVLLKREDLVARLGD